MSSFSTSERPDALVLTIDDPAVLNDFRSNTFRDAVYEAIEATEIRNVAIDLSRVDYVSSSGIAILVGVKRRVDAGGGKLALFAVQPVVLDLLRVTRLAHYFAIADDEPSALALLRSASAV